MLFASEAKIRFQIRLLSQFIFICSLYVHCYKQVYEFNCNPLKYIFLVPAGQLSIRSTRTNRHKAFTPYHTRLHYSAACCCCIMAVSRPKTARWSSPSTPSDVPLKQHILSSFSSTPLENHGYVSIYLYDHMNLYLYKSL